MSAPVPHAQAKTEGPLEASATIPVLLRAAARELAGTLGAGGCVISRLIGELLIEIAEHSDSGQSLYLGYGYVLSDYPLTADVIRLRQPRRMSLRDPDPDPGEAKLLRELGFESLLMLPLAYGDDVWGLVEVYRSGGGFSEGDEVAAGRIVARTGEVLERLEQVTRQA